MSKIYEYGANGVESPEVDSTIDHLQKGVSINEIKRHSLTGGN